MDARTFSIDELIAEASAALEAHRRGRPAGQLGQVRGALAAAVGGDCNDELYDDACEVMRALDALIIDLEAPRLVRRAS